tara:strand:- start:410 stop:916 length:507 start_codon:yes stop_codon:yes gene_type:complete
MAINFSSPKLGLQNSSGNNIPRIIQIKETNTTDWILKTAGQQVTEFNCNITPSNSTSHIWLIANVACSSDDAYDGGIVFTKGGNNLTDSMGTSAQAVNASFICGMSMGGANMDQFTGIHIDHPNTTSQVTYGLKAYPNGSRTMYINRRGIDTTYTSRSRLIVIEIGDI